jgi:hypothetical protein
MYQIKKTTRLSEALTPSPPPHLNAASQFPTQVSKIALITAPTLMPDVAYHANQKKVPDTFCEVRVVSG